MAAGLMIARARIPAVLVRWRTQSSGQHDVYQRHEFLSERRASFYSDIGRPSIDPDLMMRMLMVGYCYGIRSHREVFSLTLNSCGVQLLTRWSWRAARHCASRPQRVLLGVESGCVDDRPQLSIFRLRYI